MFQAMTDDQSATLGGIYLLIFFGVPTVLFLWACHRFGPGMAARKRDRQIETQMRLAYRDADAMDRIAQRIEDERRF